MCELSFYQVCIRYWQPFSTAYKSCAPNQRPHSLREMCRQIHDRSAMNPGIAWPENDAPIATFVALECKDAFE